MNKAGRVYLLTIIHRLCQENNFFDRSQNTFCVLNKERKLKYYKYSGKVSKFILFQFFPFCLLFFIINRVSTRKMYFRLISNYCLLSK